MILKIGLGQFVEDVVTMRELLTVWTGKIVLTSNQPVRSQARPRVAKVHGLRNEETNQFAIADHSRE
jgi:hypothetical protein